MRKMKTMRRWVFGAGMAAALGFGGAQALAAPAPAAQGEKVCRDEVCNQVCLAANNNGGFCSSQGLCVCIR
ncbi:MAG TPA: hypothetical protein VLK84_31540 [Longimicrobium sp.]|nr:hypothetical protein [Longimicrobium sp.]